tara:strand:+ start:776 stop:2062 length:1287 start_codon:yes stop_codon:yes gene_type:complete
MKLYKPLIISAYLILSSAHAKIVEESAVIYSPSSSTFEILKKHPELILDHPKKNSVEVYGPRGTIDFLKTLETNVSEQMITFSKSRDDYPTSLEIENSLKEIVENNQNIMRMFSLGKTHEGKDIWAIKISDNPEKDELEPEVKYIANMHGDEIVGRELMVLLVRELALGHRLLKPQIVHLINNLEIYIVPSMNPDGADHIRRGNSKWVDLNRDFPDFTTRDNQNSPDGRQPETKAIMEFQERRNFSLSANFHGGAEVVNYPWDTTAKKHPLHTHVLDLSLAYASLVPGMRDSIEFPKGVVNGYDWYEVNGGMQDWSYHWYEDLQVTVELSDEKYPEYYEVANYWTQNKQSLLNFLESGIIGIGLKNENQEFVEIKIFKANEKIFHTHTNKTQFFKALPKGNYQVEVIGPSNLQRFQSIALKNTPQYLD